MDLEIGKNYKVSCKTQDIEYNEVMCLEKLFDTNFDAPNDIAYLFRIETGNSIGEKIIVYPEDIYAMDEFVGVTQ